jgi:hypothetical protein
MKNERLKNGKKNPKTLKIKEEQDLKQNSQLKSQEATTCENEKI